MGGINKFLGYVHNLEDFYKEQNGIIKREYRNWGSAKSNYYRPSEREVYTHLVIPFFELLGWEKKDIAVELHQFKKDRGSVDILLLDSQTKDTIKYSGLVKFIVEVKNPSKFEKNGRGSTKRNKNIEKARRQAYDYAENCEKCRYIIITDGFEYMLYKKIT